MTRNVTIFKNIKETSTPFHREVSKILERIQQGASKEVVKKIRLEKRKNERNELKKLLPAICFSGTFNKRADSSIIEHSGLICLDFDGYEKQKELLIDKDLISKFKFVYSVFISPSGNGLKVLVKIPTDIENHTKYFNSLEKHFNSPYFDKTSKDQMDQFISNVALIAKKLGVTEKVDAIDSDSLEDYLNKLMPVIRGKFAVWAITGQEYLYNKDGKDKIGTSLGLRRYGFIATLDEMEADPNHIKPFNKDDKYDFKPVALPSADPDFKAQAPGDELPWD